MSSPTFQHRHYKAIASALAELQSNAPANDPSYDRAVSDLRTTLAKMFRRDNPRFDQSRFEAACEGAPSNGCDRR